MYLTAAVPLLKVYILSKTSPLNGYHVQEIYRLPFRSIWRYMEDWIFVLTVPGLVQIRDLIMIYLMAVLHGGVPSI